jgi:hypothetical protein
MARKVTLRGFFRDTKPFWEMGLGAVLTLSLAFAAQHLAWIATNAPRDALIILILASCYGFYLIRHFFRLAYGAVEIVIGLFAIFGVWAEHLRSLTIPRPLPCFWSSSLRACTSSYGASTISRSRHLSQAVP